MWFDTSVLPYIMRHLERFIYSKKDYICKIYIITVSNIKNFCLSWNYSQSDYAFGPHNAEYGPGEVAAY